MDAACVDSDFIMNSDYAHPTSQKREDGAVTSDEQLQITNTVDQPTGFYY